MTEQRLQLAGVLRPRGLAPLSDSLGEEDRAFAEHLRDLRERTGMTSTDLAAALDVDATRLSRFLSGQSLPEPQLLSRLHQLLAAGLDSGSVEASARESRTLLYTAARSRGPLSARAYEVAELREKLHAQQAETASALAALRSELEREQDHRRQAEQEIERLRHTDTADRDEQIERLEAERDAALRRVAQLEDAVGQTGVLLQLQQDDAQHVQEMTRATEGALERWESGDGPLPQAPEDTLWLSSELGVDGADVIEVLGELRDTDRDSEADRIIEYAALNASPIAVGALYALLDHHGRRLDADRFVDAIARHCSSVRLRKLAVDVKVPRPLFVFPGTESPGQKIGLQQEQRPFGEVLLPTVGSRTPTDVLVALVRSFRERNETGCLKSLAAPASRRPRAERRKLREAGLPPAGWLYR